MNGRLLIDGKWTEANARFAVRNKYSGGTVAEVSVAGVDDVTRAVASAQAAAREPFPPHQRQLVLGRASQLIEAWRQRFSDIIVAESGFTRKDADNEINRAIRTLQLCGEEAVRLTGDVVPMGGAPGGEARTGFTLRVPLGVVCAITPFNSPLNTVAHKVGPALAGGNAVVLKPSSDTPLTAALLVEALLEAGLPPRMIQLTQGNSRTGEALLADQRIGFYTFTGSTPVGRRIQAGAGLRRTQLELGSIASTIVCADADFDKAVPKIVQAGYRKAGQVCTSVQLLHVARSRYDEAVERIGKGIDALVVGDPAEARTDVGPLIREEAAVRVESWVKSAVDAGARLLRGGARERSVVQPALLADVDARMEVVCSEVFGPVISIVPMDSLEEAIERVNASPYGLSSGIFTRDIGAAFAAASALQVGAVHVNETSSSRLDLMPFGGSKDSGFGREGPHWAIREMTEERLVTITP